MAYGGRCSDGAGGVCAAGAFCRPGARCDLAHPVAVQHRYVRLDAIFAPLEPP